MSAGRTRKFAGTLIRLVVAFTLGVVSLLVVSIPAAQAATGSISLAKSPDKGSVLFGGSTEFTLTARNTGADEQYNLTFRDLLPVGVTYKATTSPKGVGDPQIIKVPVDPTATPVVYQQLLIWSNISDLTTGSSQSLSYTVDVDPDAWGIGKSFVNHADAWSSSNPRLVPDFTAAGEPIPDPTVVTDSAQATTSVSAIKIDKASSGTPEGEMLRGVGDHQSTYTLTVTNNTQGVSSNVKVVDYLPAGLEFLGCGGNARKITPAEYDGANTTIAPVSGCVEPTRVETVENPAGHATGVYTMVTWDLPDTVRIPAGGTYSISYAAGIPLRANTMTFVGGTPDPESGDQAANLNNNSGASTREDTDESLTLTNDAEASVTFAGTTYSDSTSHTVTVEDLRMRKTVKLADGSDFAQGQIATYTLHIDASEYVDLAGLEITDVIPKGMCPVGLPDPLTTGLPECEAITGHGPNGATITGLSDNGDGTFTITMVPSPSDSLDANGELTISYDALMRTHFDAGDASPTSARDEFTNKAEITGTSTPRKGVGTETGQLQIGDESHVTITSSGPSIQKLRMKNITPMTCSENIGDYDKEFTGETAFAEGDRVCFWLQVSFPAGVDTRNAQLTDFLPPNVTFESAKVMEGSVASTQIPSDGPPDGPPTAYVTWELGSGDNPRVAPRGSTFDVVLSGIVTTPVPATDNPTKTLKGNLAKFRYTNTAGQSSSLRDAVDVPLAPPPTMGIAKGVQSVNGNPVSGGNLPGGVDGVTVKGGDQVVFRVDPRNTTTVGAVNAESIIAPDIWDVLPAGITCAAIPPASISNGGVCYDLHDDNYPNAKGNTTNASIIRWTLPKDYSIAPASYGASLTYLMLIPDVVSVSTQFKNTASVASYTTVANTGSPSTVNLYPADNINADLPASAPNVPAATDSSNVLVPAATISKEQTTGITETGNNQDTQATIGESVTYKVTVTVPARTTVFRGAMTDPLPSGLVANGEASATFNGGSLPDGVTLDTATGALSFGTTYTNKTSTDQVFVVTIPASVSNASTSTPVQGNKITNIASFVSYTADTGGAAIGPWTASKDLSIVEPSPTLAKSADKTTVSGGDIVNYTLTLRNASGRPPLHQTSVVDCLPAGLTFLSFTAPATGTHVTSDGTDGCTANATTITWTNPGNVAGGASVSAVYQVKVNDSPAGGLSYQNSATATGDSLATGHGRTYKATAGATVNVGGASIAKSTMPTSATLTPGQTGTWKVSVTIPANTVFYAPAVMDTLPAEVDPATVTLDASSCVRTADNAACSISPTLLTPAAGQVVGWALGDVSTDSSPRVLTITYKATVRLTSSPTAGTKLTNTARLSWFTTSHAQPTVPDANWGDPKTAVSATADVTAVRPTLSITKAASTTTPKPKDTFTYTVTVTNSATNASPAKDIVVTDAVPAGVVVQDGTISNGGALSGSTITWNLPGPLAEGASIQLTYQAKLAASSTLTGTGLINRATVTGYTNEYGKPYTGGSITSTVTPNFPKVTITKAVLPDPVLVGQSATWTITLTNAQNAAEGLNAAITDSLPLNWQYDAGSARVSIAGTSDTLGDPTITETGTEAGKDFHQSLEWTSLGAVPSSSTSTATARQLIVTYTAHPLSGATTTPGTDTAAHSNSATAVVHDPTDADGYNTPKVPYVSGNPAVATTHIHRADVQIVKTSNAAYGGVAHNVAAGTDITYTLTVSNKGPNPAIGPFTVTDTLPTGVTLAAAASGTGWTCSPNGTGFSCSRTNGNNTLAANAAFPVITVKVHVPDTAGAGDTVTNSAKVTSTTYDGNDANNSSTVTDTVVRSVDLKIVKSGPATVVAGRTATYTLVVSNSGPSVGSAGTYTVTDPLPAGTTYQGASGTDWTCDSSSGTLTCTYSVSAPSHLDVNASLPSITVTLGVNSDRTTPIVNTATVTGPAADAGLDPNTGNNSSSVTTTVDTSADLALGKTASSADGDWTAGGTGTYTFTVANFGYSHAAAPQIVDNLPSYLSYVPGSSTSPHWPCTVSGNTLTCTRDASFAPGTSDKPNTESFQITVRVASGHTGPIINSATVSSSTRDPDTTNNTGTATVSDTAVKADLALEKKPDTQTVTAGQSAAVEFTLTVTNNGPSDEPGPVTVTDTLPAGLSYAGFSGAGWTSCEKDPGDARVVTCTHSGGLTSGSSRALTMRTSVSASAGPATVTNHATVTGNGNDPVVTNNSDTAEVKIEDHASVTITKTSTDADHTVIAGNQATYSLTVTNHGPSDADNVVVWDDLPAGLTFASVTANDSGWDCSKTEVRCEKGTLAAGDSASFTVQATVGSGVSANPITNTAYVDSDTSDRDSDDATITVVRKADLELEKSHPNPGDAVIAGNTVTFTLRATNHGPSDATAPVTIVDNLPPGMAYAGSDGPWDCAASGQRVECTLRDDTSVLPNTKAPDLTLLARIDSDLDPSGLTDGKLTNSAKVTSSTTDQNPDNNTATDDVKVVFDADLAITKSHTPDPATIGQDVTFTLQATNAGASTAHGVTVTDTLPDGLEYRSADGGDDWSCAYDSDSRTVSCDLDGGFAPNEVVDPITVTARVGRAAWPSVTNTAKVASSVTPDSNRDNNHFDDTVTVNDAANVTIAKSADPGTVVAGETVTYTLKATNEGPAPARNVVVEDTLDGRLTLVDGTLTAPDGWTCTGAGITGNPISCAVDQLAADAPATISFTVRVAANVADGATVPNTASISTSTAGDDPDDNSASKDVHVTTSADLGLTKQASDGATDWIAGGKGTYTFTVSNFGPSDALAPVVTDQLNDYLTFDAAAGTGNDHWTCDVDTDNLLTCTRDAAFAAGTVDAPNQETFTVSVTVDPGHTGKVENQAHVRSETSDPKPENNDGTAEVPSTQRADLGIVKSGPDTARAGDVISYTLAVHNYGESNSPAPVDGRVPAITVTDTLPSGLHIDEVSGGDDWACTVAGQTVTCALQTGLRARADAPVITVTATIATTVDADTKLSNTAAVAGPLFDPATDNNSSSHDVAVSTLADLSITKTADAETVAAGGLVTYTLVVANNGPSDARGVVVSDPLLPELGLVSATVDASGWSCEPGTTVSCSGGPLRPGAAHAVTVTVVARVGSGVAKGSVLTNTATVHSPTDPSDSSADATVDVTTRADLTLTKKHDSAGEPILAGTEVAFTLQAHNVGPSDALAQVRIVDTLPVGMTYVGNSDGWSCTAADATSSGQEVTCVLSAGNLVAGTDAAPLVMTTRVAADLDPSTTHLDNHAVVTSTTSGEPGEATDRVPVGYGADLSIVKTHAGTARVGDPLAFTLQVANAGPSVAHDVVVSDTLPAGLRYVSATGDGWTCTAPPAEGTQKISCALDATLASGTSAAPITVTTKVLASAYPGVSNTASVESATPDPATDNNTSTDEVPVPPQVDLGIAKRHEPEPMQVGDQATYTIGVSNTGSTDDPGPMTVTDTLPVGLSFVSGGGDGWSCAASGQDVTCTRDSGLKTGNDSTFSLLVSVGPEAYPSVTNTATVTSPAEDTDPSNNTASDPATVSPLYDLVVGKTLDSISRSKADWTIRVTNNGPNEAPNGAVVTDDLPSELSFVDYTGDGWTCTATGQLVTCTYDQAIAANRTVWFTLHTAINSGASGSITNSATIEGGNTDSATGDIPSGDGNLAYTGGVATGAGVLGLLLIGGGMLLVRVRRRS